MHVPPDNLYPALHAVHWLSLVRLDRIAHVLHPEPELAVHAYGVQLVLVFDVWEHVPVFLYPEAQTAQATQDDEDCLKYPELHLEQVRLAVPEQPVVEEQLGMLRQVEQE